jgi:hypothetical protein
MILVWIDDDSLNLFFIANVRTWTLTFSRCACPDLRLSLLVLDMNRTQEERTGLQIRIQISEC